MDKLLDWRLIESSLKRLINYQISDETLGQLQEFFHLLLEWNKKINLTRITEGSEASIKHFVDSLLCLQYIDYRHSRRLLDVGTGPGFPGIPIKIAAPRTEVYLLESSKKKCDFLAHVANKLGLDINIINQRAEDHVKDAREHYHYVASRALGRPELSLEICAAFVKPKGNYIQLLGPSATESIGKMKELGHKMGLGLKRSDDYDLGEEYGSRLILAYHKNSRTPAKYPRSFSFLKNHYK